MTAVAAAYRRFPEVAYVEPNYKVLAIGMPNDPMFSQLWRMDNTGQTGGTPDADIDAPEACDIATGSANVGGGIIDTHPPVPVAVRVLLIPPDSSSLPTRPATPPLCRFCPSLDSALIHL